MLNKIDHYKATLISVFLLYLVCFSCNNRLIQIFMCSYLCMDVILFFNVLTFDMIIHHILSLSLLSCLMTRTKEEIFTFLTTEISTPFLVLYRLGIAKEFTRITCVGL
jgi:hypothetical protein